MQTLLISNISRSELLFWLPEILLLLSIMHSLLIIAKRDWVRAAPSIVSRRKLASGLIVVTQFHLYWAIGPLVVFFWDFLEDDYDFSYSGFNHQLSFGLYEIACKFVLFYVMRLLLKAAAEGLGRLRRPMVEFAVLCELFIFFLSALLSANDLLVLFISLIGFSLGTYVLILVESKNHITREAAIKYYYLSALSSGFLAFALWLVYLIFLSTNFIEIAWMLHIWDFTAHRFILYGFLIFFILGFLFKLAAFPCHLWAADVYDGSPQILIAFFVLPIKFVVFSVLLKFLFITFQEVVFAWSFLLWFSSITSMVFGALYALVEKRIRKFIAYSSINQMGFLLMGAVPGHLDSVTSALVYILIYIAMNLVLFFILLSTSHVTTQRPLLYLSDFHFFAKNNIAYSTTLAVAVFSMAGIPPLAGFFGKYFLLLTAFSYHYYALVIIGLVSSAISTFYYLRIIKWLYFEQLENDLTFQMRLPQPLKVWLLLIQFFLYSYVFLFNEFITQIINLMFETTLLY